MTATAARRPRSSPRPRGPATCTRAAGCTTSPARRCTRSPTAASSRSRSPVCATADATTTTRSGAGSPTAAISPGTTALLPRLPATDSTETVPIRIRVRFTRPGARRRVGARFRLRAGYCEF
uniref:Uncharacterized protein n=1 Tax=Zea mays TaxID=4577 RepID=B7ZZK5_MAIZE|nr:unknown [Zea mays]